MRAFINRISSLKLSTTSNFDPFKILNIPRNSSAKEIKSAYFKLAKLYHPDSRTKHSLENDDKFMQITRAYEILSKKDGYLRNNSVDSNASSQKSYKTNYKDMNDDSFYKGSYSTGPLYMSNGKMAGIILLISTIGGMILSVFYVEKRSKLKQYMEESKIVSNQEYERVIQKSKNSSLEAEIKKLEKLKVEYGSSHE